MIVKQIPYSYFIQSYEYGPIGRDRRKILCIILLQYLSTWLIVTLICKFDIFQFQDPIKIKEFSETVETDEHRCPPPNLSVMVSFKCFKGNSVIMNQESHGTHRNISMSQLNIQPVETLYRLLCSVNLSAATAYR